MNNKGYIKLFIGPMFSGKTTALLNDYERNKIAGRKCLLVKHNIDNRYENKGIETHNHIIEPTCLNCSLLYEADNIVYNYDAVFIDEIQFFEDAIIFCDKWANDGIYVSCAGLNGTFERKEFPIISQLIPICEKIKKCRAICRETGNNADYSFKYQKEDNNKKKIIDIGGLDKYKAVDRTTFNNLLNNDDKINIELNKIKNFINIYNKYYTNNINLDNINDNIIINYIQNSLSKLNYKNIIEYLINSQ